MNLELLYFLICLASFCFPFILFFLIYLCQKNITDSRYWSSFPMRRRGGTFVPTNNNLSMAELGLNKDMRAMLPIIIFNESFSVKYSECSVCLGDYEENEKLQQMPECGHIFHMECIDLWLTSHITCPLCRVSLLSNQSLDRSHQGPEEILSSSMENPNEGGALAQPESQSTTEARSHIEDDQESNLDSRDISKETEENERINTRTSDGC